MIANRVLQRTLALSLIVAMLSLIAGCGTILYPERRGLAAGKYDADVVILNAMGLLFFLVPGVIAFAVDFSTGAIYLPPGEKSKIGEMFGHVEIERHDLPQRSVNGIEVALREHADLSIDLRTEAVQISSVEADAAEIETRLRMLNARFLTRAAPSQYSTSR